MGKTFKDSVRDQKKKYSHKTSLKSGKKFFESKKGLRNYNRELIPDESAKYV